MVSIEGFWTGFLLYTKRAPSIGAITWAEIEAAHPGPDFPKTLAVFLAVFRSRAVTLNDFSAGRAVMAIWNSGRSKKYSGGASSLLTNPSFDLVKVLFAEALRCCSSSPHLFVTTSTQCISLMPSR